MTGGDFAKVYRCFRTRLSALDSKLVKFLQRTPGGCPGRSGACGVLTVGIWPLWHKATS
jgi:hypothetical protein